jgi:branched-chain amino acid transport system ATP-binding protein
MLSLHSVSASYGSSQVLFDISLDVGAGEVVTLLGRNGMGKTTTIKTLMGLVPVRGGSIVFNGQSLTGLAPEAIARLGLGLVPEGRQVFPTLSVRENLIATAADRFHRANPWTLARVFGLFPRLEERADQMAATLSGGEQQMLAIGRALVGNPRLLLVDEASLGLAPLISSEIFDILGKINHERKLAILVVEQNVALALRHAAYGYILENGAINLEGKAEMLMDREAISMRYLGGAQTTTTAK